MFCISQNCVILDFGSLLYSDSFPKVLCFMLRSGVASELLFKLWFLTINPGFTDS